MKGVLVDSNVILDILTEDPKWFEWSSNTIANYAGEYSLHINMVIYSEISAAFKKIEDLEEALPATLFKKAIIPWEAAFLAGKVFLHYRRAGGNKVLPLPDFFIGAHALVENFVLLTRDSKRFQHYYPKLNIISP